MLPNKEVLFKYIDDENIIIDQEVVSDTIDLEFNFDTGEFYTIDGKVQLVDRINRVKQWIEKAIKTDAYVNRLYKYSHYGMYTDRIIGYVYDKQYIDALIKQELEYLMSLCYDIDYIENIEISNEGDELTVKYNVILVSGEEFEYEGSVIMSV